MKDLCSASRIWEIGIFRNRSSCDLFLSQQAYLKKVLNKFGLDNLKAVATPLSSQFKLSLAQVSNIKEERMNMKKIPYVNLVGSVMYTCPVLTYAISLVSRYMGDSAKEHSHALKWLMRYVSGIHRLGLNYGRREFQSLISGYVDADYGGCLDTRKSMF